MTEAVPRYLLDTNILLRLIDRSHPSHALINRCVDCIIKTGAEVNFSAQNISELWNVMTRPISANGLGLNCEDAELAAYTMERRLLLAPDSSETYMAWRSLVVHH